MDPRRLVKHVAASAVLAIFLAASAPAQARAGADAQSDQAKVQQKAPGQVTLNFSAPDLDAPLQLPSTLMEGPPSCSAQGNAFYKFWTSRSSASPLRIVSISPKGVVVEYSVAKITDLKFAQVVGIDPGSSRLTLLLNAKPTDTGEGTHFQSYLARYRYDGTLDRYSRLGIKFQPGELAQLGDDAYLVIGTDPATGTDPAAVQPHVALVDDRGTLLRSLDADKVIPSVAAMSQMMSAETFVGLNPNTMPPSLRLSFLMSSFRFVHDGENLLLLEPGVGAKILDFLPDAEVRTVSLHLPQGQVAESLIVAPGKWIIRTHRADADDRQAMFQIDPATGEAEIAIGTGEVPATSIACATDDGFFGLRWIDQKPYLISGSY